MSSMKYFLFEQVPQDTTTLDVVVPPGVNSFKYTDNLVGVDIEMVEDFLTLQHPECNVQEVQFEVIENELKNCKQYKDIDEIVKTMIHNVYTLDDEIKLLKLDKTDPEYVAYQSYVDACRATGRSMKIERGLRNAG